MEDNYAYVLVTQKVSGLEISLFKDLDAAKESKREDDGVFTGWVEKYGGFYCLHSPEDEEWYIFKRKVNSEFVSSAKNLVSVLNGEEDTRI